MNYRITIHSEGCPVWAEMAQAEPFEPDLGHASEGTGRHYSRLITPPRTWIAT